MDDAEGRRYRHDGWTAARRTTFIDHLCEHCHVQAAAAAGMKTCSVYRLRRRDPAFAEAWREAIAAGYEALETELLARALQRSEGAEGEFDVELAFRLLGRHRAPAPGPRRIGGPKLTRATPAETDAAILKKLDMLEKRLKARE